MAHATSRTRGSRLGVCARATIDNAPSSTPAPLSLACLPRLWFGSRYPWTAGAFPSTARRRWTSTSLALLQGMPERRWVSWAAEPPHGRRALSCGDSGRGRAAPPHGSGSTPRTLRRMVCGRRAAPASPHSSVSLQTLQFERLGTRDPSSGATVPADASLAFGPWHSQSMFLRSVRHSFGPRRVLDLAPCPVHARDARWGYRETDDSSWVRGTP